MSVQSTKHILNEIFTLPDPNRTEPFVPTGITNARLMSEGWFEEALIDYNFTSKSEIQSYENERAVIREAKCDCEPNKGGI